MTKGTVTNSLRKAEAYLQLAEAIGGLPVLPPVDPLEERLLGCMARAASQGERLCVRDMLAREEYGSPATIHNRLTSMRVKGWIALEDTEDARRKQLALTKEAMSHFARLSKAMIKAAAG